MKDFYGQEAMDKGSETIALDRVGYLLAENAIASPTGSLHMDRYISPEKGALAVYLGKYYVRFSLGSRDWYQATYDSTKNQYKVSRGARPTQLTMQSG